MTAIAILVLNEIITFNDNFKKYSTIQVKQYKETYQVLNRWYCRSTKTCYHRARADHFRKGVSNVWSVHELNQIDLTTILV